VTWTYVVAQLSTTPLYQVRFMLGDTLPADQQLQDEEINFAISQESSVYGAAAACCRNLGARLSREADSIVGEQRTLYSSRAKAYRVKAAEFEALSIARGGGLPYAGGISIADKATNEADSDRVSPEFQKGMTDNLIPVGPAGNESSTPQEPD
jgi:hypothetical protein